jgi:hypothetical protein
MAINYTDYLQQFYEMDSNDHTRGIGLFQSKFECQIEDSEKFKQYVRRMPYHLWDGRVPFEADTQVVPMKAIHLSIDNLEKLIAEQELMQHLKYDAEQGKRLWRREHEDIAVRAANPAVEKAYRNYQTLLELCRK